MKPTISRQYAWVIPWTLTAVFALTVSLIPPNLVMNLGHYEEYSQYPLAFSVLMLVYASMYSDAHMVKLWGSLVALTFLAFDPLTIVDYQAGILLWLGGRILMVVVAASLLTASIVRYFNGRPSLVTDIKNNRIVLGVMAAAGSLYLLGNPDVITYAVPSLIMSGVKIVLGVAAVFYILRWIDRKNGVTFSSLLKEITLAEGIYYGCRVLGTCYLMGTILS